MAETQYEIYEQGSCFAIIKAESAEQALEIAAAEFRRRSRDYNGYTGPITWYAFAADETYEALALASIELQVI